MSKIRQLLSILIRPLFIFLAGNVIVLTVIIKSGSVTEANRSMNNVVTNLYEDIIINVSDDAPPILKHEEIFNRDK